MVSKDNMKIYINDIYYDILADVYYKIESISNNGEVLNVSIYWSAEIYGDYVALRDIIRDATIKYNDFISKWKENLNLIYRDEIFL